MFSNKPIPENYPLEVKKGQKPFNPRISLDPKPISLESKGAKTSQSNNSVTMLN